MEATNKPEPRNINAILLKLKNNACAHIHMFTLKISMTYVKYQTAH